MERRTFRVGPTSAVEAVACCWPKAAIWMSVGFFAASREDERWTSIKRFKPLTAVSGAGARS
jgi:hypothetical protein